MNNTSDKLLQLAQQKDISSLGLRQLARELGVKNPQTIKYHLTRLYEKGLLQDAPRASVKIEKSKLGESSLITIPIKGTVSAGPATQYATDQVTGYLRVSSTLLNTKNYKDLFAAKVVGNSMNRANVNGQTVDDGDLAIIDASKRSPKNGDYIVAVVDGLANLKKYLLDKINNQIVLVSESSEDYQPIFVHPEDDKDSLINGTVIQMMKYPAGV
jgi:repressor LexA